MVQTPGWYGKLPALGDFASRRLPADYVAEWDSWLQQGMSAAKQQLGETWLDSYLTSPLWHFVLGNGTIGNTMWAGVLLPSVDRVGRYFPLMVCAPLAGFACANQGVHMLDPWLEQLENAARMGLNASAGIEDFEAALAACPPPPCEPAKGAGAALAAALLAGSSFERIESKAGTSLTDLARDAGAQFAQHMMSRHSVWWCGNDAGALGGFVCSGMPDPHVFARMLQYSPI